NGNGEITYYTHNVSGFVTEIRDAIAGVDINLATSFAGQLVGAPGIAHQVAAVDMNRDGWPDLVGVFELNSQSTLAILHNLGDGTFAEPYQQPLTPGAIYSLEIADLDLDGLPDVMVSETGPGQPGVLRIFQGSATTTLGVPMVFQLPGGQVTDIGITHLNDDLLPDIVIAADTRLSSDPNAPRPGVIMQFTQQVDNTIDLTQLSGLSAVPGELRLADLNSDGIQDVVVAVRESNGSLAWLEGYIRNAEGALGDAVSLLAANGQTSGGPDTLDMIGRFVLEDLDQDGLVDIAAIVRPAGQQHSLAVRYGEPANGFGLPQLTALNSNSELDLIAVDWDNDSTTELLALGGDVVRSLQQNDGMFEVTASSVAARGVNGSIADLNDDGYLDIVTIHNLAGAGTDPESRSLLIREGNGTGRFGSSDVTDQLAIISIRSPLAADFNSDGRTDLALVSTENTPFVPQGINVLLSDTDGNFSQRSIFSTPQSLETLLLLPRDDSNTVDLLGRYESAIQPYINDGNGTFTAADYFDFSSELGAAGSVVTASAVVVSRENTDPIVGVPWRGLLLGGGQMNYLSILSIGGGQVTSLEKIPIPGRPLDAVAEDLDGDGFVDWLVSGFSDQNNQYELWFVRGTSDGTWSTTVSVTSDIEGRRMTTWRPSPTSPPQVVASTFNS
ncbi:MAG: VCBS repeat-containing protein, partial [Planctomycetales bacterium]|nr:VCBS repeat-containing protein [Planctomycetales bacterium]